MTDSHRVSVAVALALLCLFVAYRVALGASQSEWVRVPADAFTMGVDGASPDEQPAHSVGLAAYEIGRYEVTNAEYLVFCQATGDAHAPADLTGVRDFGSWPERALARPSHPVVGVSWEDASAYCRSRGGRLPTEAEWEKAARGHSARVWPWGMEQDVARANTSGSDAHATTSPVGSYPAGASPYGAQDMAGNVAEWVADWYSDSYYARSPSTGPLGPGPGQRKVIRGGGWADSLMVSRSTRRLGVPPTMRAAFVGFRVARPATE